jgi:hypothetical protein
MLGVAYLYEARSCHCRELWRQRKLVIYSFGTTRRVGASLGKSAKADSRAVVLVAEEGLRC